jgi:hypothetical protein
MLLSRCFFSCSISSSSQAPFFDCFHFFLYLFLGCLSFLFILSYCSRLLLHFCVFMTQQVYLVSSGPSEASLLPPCRSPPFNAAPTVSAGPRTRTPHTAILLSTPKYLHTYTLPQTTTLPRLFSCFSFLSDSDLHYPHHSLYTPLSPHHPPSSYFHTSPPKPTSCCSLPASIPVFQPRKPKYIYSFVDRMYKCQCIRAVILSCVIRV